MPPDWLLDQLLCLNSLGGLLTSLASNPTTPPPPFFILSTHTDEHTHAWPATPDDWLFVCAEEFPLRCVRGNWSPCGPVPITGPPPEGCSAFPMIVGRDSKRVLKAGFQLGGWDPQTGFIYQDDCSCPFVQGNYSLIELSENLVLLIEDISVLRFLPEGWLLFRKIMTSAALHLIKTWNLYPFYVNTPLPSSLLIWLYENFKQWRLC